MREFQLPNLGKEEYLPEGIKSNYPYLDDGAEDYEDWNLSDAAREVRS